MRNALPHVLAALVGLGLLTTSEASARAGDEAVPIAVAVAVVAVDLGFGIYDTTVVARRGLPSQGVATAEALVAAPQMILAHIGHGLATSMSGAEDTPGLAALVLVPGAVDAMFVHGMWGANTTIAIPGAYYGVSAAIGFDTALTTAALTYAGCGRTGGKALGSTAMILTAPQIAASSYGIVKDPGNRAGWGVLAGGSGALFTYGLASLVAPNPGGSCGEPAPVVEPPRPSKPPLLVPDSIQIAPTALAGGSGLVVQGRWM
jgi:hypothetical protein